MATKLNFEKVQQHEVTLGEMASRGLLKNDFDGYWAERAKTNPKQAVFLYLYPLSDDSTAAGVYAVIFWCHEERCCFDDVVHMLNQCYEEDLEASVEYRWVK